MARGLFDGHVSPSSRRESCGWWRGENRATVRERADYSQILHGQAQPLREPGRRSCIEIHIHRLHIDYP
jgi:hypothetical protein